MSFVMRTTIGTTSPDPLRPAENVAAALDQAARLWPCDGAERSGPLSRAAWIAGVRQAAHPIAAARDLLGHRRAPRRPAASQLARRERTADRRHRQGDPGARRRHALTFPPSARSVGPCPRASAALANAFLDHVDSRFDEERFVAFLQGAQEVRDLTLGEIWAIRPALQLALIERIIATITTGGGGDIPVLINSLRALADARWKDVFAQVNVVDRVLARRSRRARTTGWMTTRSDHYRRAVSELAERSGRSERDIAEEAVALACESARSRRHQPRRPSGAAMWATISSIAACRYCAPVSATAPTLRAVGHRPRLRAADTLLSRRDRDHDGGDPPRSCCTRSATRLTPRSLRPSC